MRRLSSLLLSLLALVASPLRAEPARSVVPMTLTQSDYGGGRIYLPARFGNMSGTMRLDTGASKTRVALAPWNRDLPVIAQSASTGASGRTVACDDVAALNVGLKASQGNDVARGKYEVARCATSDGDDLLGLDFFRNTRFTLNFVSREMVFFGDPPGPGAKPFRIIGPEKKLVGLDFHSGNVASAGLFDTGAEICAVDLAFLKKHRKLFAPAKEKLRASEAGGGRFASRLFRIKTIDLGEGRVAHDVYALAYDFGVLREALGPEAPFILGMNLINRFNWALDFRDAGRPMWEATTR